MRLKSFRVQNFHSVIDSGLINVSEITAFIGANQAGKSSLLLGLASISPESSYEDFDLTQLAGVSKRFLDGELKASEVPIVEARFALSDNERKELQKIGLSIKEDGEFAFTKYYDGSYRISSSSKGKYYKLPSRAKLVAAHRAVVDCLTKFRDASGQHMSKEQNLKFAKEFKSAVAGLKFSSLGELTTERANASLTKIEEFAKLGIDDAFKQSIAKFAGSVREILSTSLAETNMEASLYGFLSSYLPRTVYFKSFDKLLDEATVSELRSGKPAYRTFANLLRLSGLKVESLQRIRNEKQRQAYLEQASGQATKLLRKAWNQEEMQIEFRYQGERLMVFIKDSSAVETLLPPGSGSEGFQWFLGFFINFGALTNAEYTNAILLLDDPGVYLHPSAHKDLLKLFEEFLKKNVTTIYSTHQPFLIPTDRLDRLRLVTKVPDGHSLVTKKFFATEDKEVLSPVRAALGVTLEDTLLTGKYTIITETAAEKNLIEAVIKEFSKRGLAEFSNLENLVVLAAPNTAVCKLYSVLLQLNGLAYVTVFSNSVEGKSARNDLLKAELPEANLIIFPRSSDQQKYSDMEDVFPIEMYAEALDGVYGSSLNIRFEELVPKLQQGSGRVNGRAKALLRAKKIEIDRVLLSRELARLLAIAPDIDDKVKNNFAELFGDISDVIHGFVASSSVARKKRSSKPTPTPDQKSKPQHDDVSEEPGAETSHEVVQDDHLNESEIEHALNAAEKEAKQGAGEQEQSRPAEVEAGSSEEEQQEETQKAPEKQVAK